MAGVVPTRGKSSGRKQWTLHDGPRGSLRRLRSQLASDGCADSQVILAKQLLDEECELDMDKNDNARLGVYWLIKASEQGNVEATELLSKCLVTGRGITEHNYIDVKSCINMTQDEKIARKAAREMFASLSNGEDFITSDQLQKRMLEIQNEDCPRKRHTQLKNEQEADTTVNNVHYESSDDDIDWSTRQDSPNEKLTEDHLVSAAVNYTNGQLPLVNRVLCLAPPDLNGLNHIPYVQRSILHPILNLRILYCRVLRFLGGLRFPTVGITRNELTLLAVVVYLLFSVKHASLFLPMLLYYVSLFTLVVTTFQMLQDVRNYRDFRVWSGLFLSYSDGGLNPGNAESLFLRNNLGVYGKYFVALIINLMVFPLISDQWIPHSEITVVAFFFMCVTLGSFTFTDEAPRLLVLASFAVNVLAKYPYESDPVVTQGWRFLDINVPNYMSWVIGNGIEFCLNFHLFFYVLIPIIFVYIAHRESWRGVYKYLVPHCVTLSWLQLVVINSRGVSVFCLLRSTFAVVGVVLFLPLFGVVTVMLPAAATLRWIFTTNALFNGAIYVGVAGSYWGVSWLLARTRFVRYIGYIQIVLGLVAAYLLFNPVTTLDAPLNHKRALSWEQYQAMCHQPAWDASNVANTQIRCQKLLDVPVSWTGYVNEVRLTSVTNNWSQLLKRAPKFIADYLSCYLHGTVDSDCVSDTIECQAFRDAVKSKEACPLERYDAYEFDISIRMQSGIWGKSAELHLQADHPFANFTRHLKPNDKIWFSGALVNKPGPDSLLGGAKPHVRLKEIGCLACHNMNLTHFKADEDERTEVAVARDYLVAALKFILNILFNPVVVIK